MEYYFAVDYDHRPRTFGTGGKPLRVFRWYHDDKGSHPEMWDGTNWVLHPDLIAVSGMGGDSIYAPTTEELAKEFIKAQS